MTRDKRTTNEKWNRKRLNNESEVLVCRPNENKRTHLKRDAHLEKSSIEIRRKAEDEKSDEDKTPAQALTKK